MRGTFTHNNLDFGEDVKHLADLGFEQISVEPVVAEPSEPYALKEEDLPVLLEEYDKLAAELLKRQKEGKGVNFFHFMIDLSSGLCKRLSAAAQGQSISSVATPWEELHPCPISSWAREFLSWEMWMVTESSGRISGMKFKTCNVYAKK